MPDTTPSRRQLELQARIAQRRIEKIRQILETELQAPADATVDPDMAEVILRLYDPSLSEADLLSCVGIIELSLEIEGLSALLNVMKSDGFGITVRNEAAKAIKVIGNDHVREELEDLLSSSSREVSLLAQIALGTMPPDA